MSNLYSPTLWEATQRAFKHNRCLDSALGWANSNPTDWTAMVAALDDAVATANRVDAQPLNSSPWRPGPREAFLGYVAVPKGLFQNITEAATQGRPNLQPLVGPDGAVTPRVTSVLRPIAKLVGRGEAVAAGAPPVPGEDRVDFTAAGYPPGATLMGLLVNVLGAAAAPTIVDRSAPADRIIEAGLLSPNTDTKATFVRHLGQSGVDWLGATVFSPDFIATFDTPRPQA